MFPRLTMALAAAVLVPTSATAQRLEPRAFPLRKVQTFTLQSPSMGVRYDITVGGLRTLYYKWPIWEMRRGAATQ